MDSILQRLAERSGESVEAVWERFQRHHFSGNMMHLRDIERAFGPGTLRVYATVRAGDENMANIMEGYLRAESGGERRKAAEKIFASARFREFADYQRKRYEKRASKLRRGAPA
jgi:D-mannonate dehydratase